MKKRVAIFTVALVIGLCMTSFTSYVNAKASKEGEEEGGWCIIKNAAGDAIISMDVHMVRTNNRNGNAMVMCKADGVPNDTGEAQVFKGGREAKCQAGADSGKFPETNRMMVVVSASGHARLTCHANGSVKE